MGVGSLASPTCTCLCISTIAGVGQHPDTHPASPQVRSKPGTDLSCRLLASSRGARTSSMGTTSGYTDRRRAALVSAPVHTSLQGGPSPAEEAPDQRAARQAAAAAAAPDGMPRDDGRAPCGLGRFRACMGSIRQVPGMLHDHIVVVARRASMHPPDALTICFRMCTAYRLKHDVRGLPCDRQQVADLQCAGPLPAACRHSQLQESSPYEHS
jgi:hypothetical protein